LKKKLTLELAEQKQIAKDIYEFAFRNRSGEPALDLGDKPGQYLEWTLPHARPDSRGIRRYFSIASGYDEEFLKIGVKITNASSTFKKKLLSMNPGDTITVGSLAGDFVLPKNQNEKLVFIAGGIGITPFRAMIKYILMENKKRDVILFYSVKSEDEIAYRNVLDQIKTYYVVEEFITEKIIGEKAPDFKERTFYLSGPEAMVNNYKDMLRKIGVQKIKTDYFPGY
jgi:ferredoxin-NADP reductase